MIVVQMLGGLGNQFFQYAFGRYLAERHGTQLRLDVGQFQYDTKREYELDAYQIEAEIASHEEICRVTGWPQNRREQFKQKIFGRQENVVREENPTFHPDLLHLPDDIYLMGYFQCEEYFLPIRDKIRKELTPKAAPLLLTAELIAHAQSSNSVSLHVRRGDYISDPAANARFGVVNLDYYRRAIAHIEEHVSDPTFFVFSDEIEWARENLELSGKPIFVDHTGPTTSAEDIRLMRACHHNIIANSSFSWWGAWLGEHGAKIVVSPSRWTSDEEGCPRDIVPKNWQRM